MTKKRKIAPSILAADFSRLCEQIKLVEKAGAEVIHVDVMDGHFVPNITIGPAVVRSVRTCTDLFLDVHLMIEHPLDYVDAFAKVGANNITFHIEAPDDAAAVIKKIKNHNINAGLSVKPATSISLVQSKHLAVDIEVDGGVTMDNIKEISLAGAEIIVAGSEIFGADDATQRFKELNDIVNS